VRTRTLGILGATLLVLGLAGNVVAAVLGPAHGVRHTPVFQPGEHPRSGPGFSNFGPNQPGPGNRR
jgi:hypothetical protein